MYIQIELQAYTQLCTCVSTGYKDKCVYLYVWVYVYIMFMNILYIYTYLQACTYIYVHVNIHIKICTYVFIYTVYIETDPIIKQKQYTLMYYSVPLNYIIIIILT